jgi:hypothetical protein
MAIEGVAQNSQLQSSYPAQKFSTDQDKRSTSVALEAGKAGESPGSRPQGGNGGLVDIYARRHIKFKAAPTGPHAPPLFFGWDVLHVRSAHERRVFI